MFHLFQGVSICFRVFLDISGYFRVFHLFQGYFRVFQGVSGCFKYISLFVLLWVDFGLIVSDVFLLYLGYRHKIGKIWL